jgi:hypothetical protein
MKDSEARGIVLERFYDARHKIGLLGLDALSTHVTIPPQVLANICAQLGEYGLIDWRPLKAIGHVGGMGRITARGVDVIEGNTTSPITVTLHDHSISVVGSHNVQIGNANQQTIALEIAKLADVVEGMNVSDADKKEAKGLIEKITNNPLIVAAFGSLFGKAIGG